MAAQKFSIYAGPPITEALAATKDDGPDGNRSGRLNTIASRYLAIMADAMPEFSRAEWCAIMDANNGVYLLDFAGRDLATSATLWANLADSEGIGEKWDIDETRLVKRIRDLPLAAKFAIAEAVQRFWVRADMSTDAALRAAGCRISEG